MKKLRALLLAVLGIFSACLIVECVALVYLFFYYPVIQANAGLNEPYWNKIRSIGFLYQPVESKRRRPEWNPYHYPPIRNPAESWVSSYNLTPENEHGKIYTNRFRMVKNNNNPYDQEAIDPDAFRILITGGSSTLGLGSLTNAETYSSQLAELIKKEIPRGYRLKKKVQVLNFGVSDFRTLDELVLFISELNYIRPDMWLMFSGINEGWTETDEISIPPPLAQIHGRSAFKKRAVIPNSTFLPAFFYVYNLRKLQSTKAQLVADFTWSANPLTLRTHAEIFAKNIQLAEGAAKGAGVKFIHVLQPTLAFGTHKPTAEEVERKNFLIGPVEWAEQVVLAGNFYQRAKKLLPYGNANLWDFSGMFDSVPDTVYFDPRHYSKRGNELIARELLRRLQKNFFRDLYEKI